MLRDYFEWTLRFERPLLDRRRLLVRPELLLANGHRPVSAAI